MKNPIIIFFSISLVAVVGFGVFTLSRNSSPSDPMKKSDETIMQGEDKANNSEKMVDDTSASSRYVENSNTALQNASGNRRVLFFYASWCPTCRPADAEFRNYKDKIPADVVVIRVNYNDPETDQEEKDLANQYGVSYQHTFVQIDSDGNEITKWNGGQIDELLSRIKKQ